MPIVAMIGGGGTFLRYRLHEVEADMPAAAGSEASGSSPLMVRVRALRAVNLIHNRSSS